MGGEPVRVDLRVKTRIRIRRDLAVEEFKQRTLNIEELQIARIQQNDVTVVIVVLVHREDASPPVVPKHLEPPLKL